MKMPVTLDIEVEAAWEYNHRLQIFTDNGSGTLETDPIFDKPFSAFPEAQPDLRWGESTWGRGKWGGIADFLVKNKYAWGEWPWGDEPNGWGGGGESIRILVYVAQGVGDYKFAARSVDGAGNVQSGADVEFTQAVSGENPFPLFSFAYTSYDSDNDQLTFSVRE